MPDEISYAARYGTEFVTAFIAGYASGYVRDRAVGEPESVSCWDDVRKQYPMEADHQEDIFSYLADNSSLGNEALKFTLASTSYLATELASDEFSPQDHAVIFSGFYTGFTTQEADWDDIQEALS